MKIIRFFMSHKAKFFLTTLKEFVALIQHKLMCFYTIMTRRLLTSFGLGLVLMTIPAKSQFVKETFTDPLYSDNFETDAGNWKIQSNADNLFLIQDGEYLLKRRNTSTGYSVFTTWKLQVQAFEIAVRINLEKSTNKESSAGIIFMAQEDGTGAFVFEFNCQQQYRLKQLVGVNYRLLTGEGKNNGWVNSEVLSPNDAFNLIQVRSNNRNYDIYINQKYLFSFTELAYKSGKLGINAGPSSNIHVDSFSVFGLSTDSDKPQNEQGPCEEVNAKLKAELGILRKDNQVLQDSVQILNKKIEQMKSKSQPNKTKHLE